MCKVGHVNRLEDIFIKFENAFVNILGNTTGTVVLKKFTKICSVPFLTQKN